MALKRVRLLAVAIAIVTGDQGVGRAQETAGSWLDEVKPVSWNRPGQPIPAAPRTEGPIDSKCREAARPPQLDEDKALRDQGRDLVGTYQGGWQTLLTRGTAGYDGMCRPRQYQDFVFVRGRFAGTLSPHAMDSRTDGALSGVSLQSERRLTADYVRYAARDPLCCPSRVTTVVFDISGDPPVLVPVSTTTRGTTVGSSGSSSSELAGTSWQLVKFQGSDDTTLTPDDRTKYTLAFGTDGQLSARIDCNRGRGTWKSNGPNQVELGPLALTRAMCPPGSMHDQIVKQWGSVRSYVIPDGHLFLSLMADGGIYEFEPASTRAPAVAPR